MVRKFHHFHYIIIIAILKYKYWTVHVQVINKQIKPLSFLTIISIHAKNWFFFLENHFTNKNNILPFKTIWISVITHEHIGLVGSVNPNSNLLFPFLLHPSFLFSVLFPWSDRATYSSDLCVFNKYQENLECFPKKRIFKKGL